MIGGAVTATGILTFRSEYPNLRNLLAIHVLCYDMNSCLSDLSACWHVFRTNRVDFLSNVNVNEEESMHGG